MAAPQGFGLVGFKFKILSSNEFLCYDGCWFQGDLLNGIVETVSGENKRYDSPPYNVVATYTVGSKSVSFFKRMHNAIETIEIVDIKNVAILKNATN